jgi:hypothetical protein
MGFGMTIFLDLETVPDGDMPTLNELKIPGTMSRADTIQKWKEDKEARDADLDNMYRKRALDYVEGKVLCLSFAVNDEPIEGIINDDENQLFKDFEKELGKHDGVYRSAPTLVAHNGRIFDYPFTFLRSCRYKCHELISVFSPPNNDFFKDTMRMFCATDFKGMVSLENACKFFNIPTSKDKMKGSEVYDYYLDKKYDEIMSYCKEDVRCVRELFYILTGNIK